MSFHEVQFPSDVSYGATGGPTYSTSIVMSDSGYEQRNINWAEARGKWNVAQGVKEDDQAAELVKFFRARKGRAYGFRFKDWTDYQAVEQPAGLISGETVKHQLRKQYQSGPRTEVRIITKPVAGTLTLTDDGSPRTDWTLDTTTGIITLDSPAVGVISTTFEFDVPARFDTDEMQMTVEFFNSNNWTSIQVVELRQ